MYAPLYVAGAQAGLVDRRRMLRAERPFRLVEMFGEFFRSHAHAARALEGCPALRIMASRVCTGETVALGEFESVAQVRQAAWASRWIPMSDAEVVHFRGGALADRALTDPVPYTAALEHGATHVLVLRTRSARYRKDPWRGPLRKVMEAMLRGASGVVRELVLDFPRRYNAQARELQSGDLAERVVQLAPHAHAPVVPVMEWRADRLWRAIAVGVGTVYRALPGTQVAMLLSPAADETLVADGCAG